MAFDLLPLTSRYCQPCGGIFPVGAVDEYDKRTGTMQRFMPTHCGRDTIPCPTFGTDPGGEYQDPRMRARQTILWLGDRAVAPTVGPNAKPAAAPTRERAPAPASWEGAHALPPTLSLQELLE